MKAFKDQTNLMLHKNIHSGIKSHQCNSCESKFSTHNGLYKHTKYKHSHKKPLHCTECKYMSVEKVALSRHMSIHTGERPHKCNDCSYAASDKSVLRRHMRTHTGEQPYKCDICKKRFTQQNSLKEHSDLHNKIKPRFKCILCPVYTTRKRDMAAHTKRYHTVMLSFPCPKCNMTFTDMIQLRKHQKNHLLKTYTKRLAGTIENQSTKIYKNKCDFYKTEMKEFDNENEDGEISGEQQKQITQKMYLTLEIKQQSEVKEQYSTDVNFVKFM